MLSHAIWTRVVRLGTTLGLRYNLGLAVRSNWCSYDQRWNLYILMAWSRGAASRVVARLGGPGVRWVSSRKRMGRAAHQKDRAWQIFYCATSRAIQAGGDSCSIGCSSTRECSRLGQRLVAVDGAI